MPIIEIDTTNLVYKLFQIPRAITHWVSSGKFDLVPKDYNFQFASGYQADFTFKVKADGTVDYDQKFDAFLQGRGTSKLTLKGLEVTLDARYLAGAGVTLVVPETKWIVYEKCFMLPASHHQVQQGSGEVTSFGFILGLDGKFSYDPAYDYGNGGFLRGRQENTLEFLGYPLLVDARAAGGARVTLQPIHDMPFSPTSVAFANLLPAASFALQVNSGVVSKAVFSLDTHGKFAFDSSLSPYLKLKEFHGLTLLKAKGPLP
jgi:hypothetical protein